MCIFQSQYSIHQMPWGKNGSWERLHVANLIRVTMRQLYNGLIAFNYFDSQSGKKGFDYQFETERVALSNLKATVEKQKPVYAEAFTTYSNGLWLRIRKTFLVTRCVWLLVIKRPGRPGMFYKHLCDLVSDPFPQNLQNTFTLKP